MKPFHEPAASTVAFLGIGLMGMPMTLNLVAAGYQLRVWNRTRHKAEVLRSDSVQVADSVEEALQGADCVITMLESGPVVDAILYRQRTFEASAPGTLFIDMSSIPPPLARDHQQQLHACGRRYLDAPVSGGTVGAAQASLSIMAGGDPDDFEAARPLFEVLGTPHLIGPCGSGQLAKLANQAIVGITIGAVSEALLLAAAGGADPAAVRRALGDGFAGSRILDIHGLRMIQRDFVPGATSRVQLKDLRAILETARSQGLSLPLTERVYQDYQALVRSGKEELDHSALLLQLESLNQPFTLGDGETR